jgi:hypothetical protein
MEILPFKVGGYRFIKGVFQYSAGVAAANGYRLVRVRFRRSVALAEGFKRVEQMITGAGRPMTSFCACELRSPAPFTEGGFADFNKIYVDALTRWGIFDGTTNPVARSNVCPAIDPPDTPSFHAFAYLKPQVRAPPRSLLPAAARRPRGREVIATAPFGSATRALMDFVPRHCSCLARWSDGLLRLVILGVIQLQPKSIPCTTSIRFSPMKSYDAAPRDSASLGITTDPRLRILNMKWIAGAPASNV